MLKDTFTLTRQWPPLLIPHLIRHNFLGFFKLLLEPSWAETAAMIVVPLFQLFVAMLVMRGMMRELRMEADKAVLGLAIIPLFPLLLTNFMPMRIDHHGWQAVGAAVATWMLLRGTYRSAMIGGATTAAWLYISVEGMPLAAAIGRTRSRPWSRTAARPSRRWQVMGGTRFRPRPR